MEVINHHILLKDFIIKKDIIIFNLELIKLIKENNLIIKVYKKNSIYNYIFSKKIISKDFHNINPYFQHIKTIESIIDILLYIIDSKSILIKEIKYDSLILVLKYKTVEFKLILEKEFNSILEKKFENNPSLKFKEIITNNNDVCGISDTFEVYIDFNNKKILASPNKETHRIDLYDLDNKNTIIRSLRGHSNFITFIKCFNDKIKDKKYLISIDNIKLIIIWDIKNNYIKKRITLDYKGIIYSALLIFNIYDNDYIITSSYNILEFSKVFSLDKKKFISNIYSTDKNYTRYIIPWEKENYEGYYIIEFCDSKISFINIFEEEIYITLKTEDKTEKYCNGFLFYKNNSEYLCSGGWSGNIYIWNLNEITLENIIETNAFNGIGYIVYWSHNFIIGTDFNGRGLIVVDLKYYKVVSNYEHIHNKGVICIKKIEHSIYGESLLVGSNDGVIKLWNTNSF